MILLDYLGKLMFQQKAVTTSSNGRWGKRRSSAVRTLVAETLVLAKTHGYVEKIEDELERELQRDFSDPPQKTLLRWRRAGDKIFKSKYMLLIVVVLCIVDCALVLGELTLDLYKVKATLEDSEVLKKVTDNFVAKFTTLHPTLIDRTAYDIFALLLDASVKLNLTIHDSTATYNSMSNCSPCLLQNTTLTKAVQYTDDTNDSVIFVEESAAYTNYDVEIIGEIAHVFHYCSISILAVIMIETALKAICAGKSFFHRKIEVFDAFVVVVSFLMDFSFLVFLHDIDTKDFVFILAILLPWRVIRVVNSLIVSVKDHEHFRLKLVYKRKKKIQGTLRDTECLLQKYMNQSTALQRLCIMEGIEEWKVDNYLKSEESVPPTPSKKKFKFKFDEPKFHMQGFNRAKRLSMPTLDFHGLKQSNGHSKSKLFLPSVAKSIKHHISNSFPSRRASLSANEIYNAKMTNGDIQRRKIADSGDLCTMHEEGSENEGSVESSRATSEYGDGLCRNSNTESVNSVRTHVDTKSNVSNFDSAAEDECIQLANFKEAKRRHSESTLDREKIKNVNLHDLADIIAFKIPGRKKGGNRD